MTIHPGNMKKFGIGQPIRRVEDRKFITGEGRYTDDIAPQKAVHAYILRSPHACARFKITDLEAAKAAKGVLAVWTAADVAGFEGVACQAPLPKADGSLMVAPKWPLLCDGASCMSATRWRWSSPTAPPAPATRPS